MQVKVKWNKSQWNKILGKIFIYDYMEKNFYTLSLGLKETWVPCHGPSLTGKQKRQDRSLSAEPVLSS